VLGLFSSYIGDGQPVISRLAILHPLVCSWRIVYSRMQSELLLVVAQKLKAFGAGKD
jgi:hypothetical protein